MDDIITLIKEEIVGRDKYGNEIVKKTKRDVMCRVYGVMRSEFYAAAASDLNPEFTIRLSDYADYNEERLVKFHDTFYSVVRVYRDAGSFQHGEGFGPNGIELILEKKTGDPADIEES